MENRRAGKEEISPKCLCFSELFCSMEPAMHEERCVLRNPTPPPFREQKLQSETELSAELVINELRGRLERRNALLDVIRKAYHRDVLVIKESLLNLQKRCINNSDNVDSLLGLDSIPSIDLRETFRLFSPQDCELRVRPCWNCGGQLEVIHQESARIVKFKHSIQLLEEKEKDLRMELVNTKVRAQEDCDHMGNVMERCKDERDVLVNQILSLKHQVADRNALDVEVKRLQSEKQNLEAKLEQQQPILEDHALLAKEIVEVKEDARQWKAKFHEETEQNKRLQSEIDSTAQQLNKLRQENQQQEQHLAALRKQCQQSEARCSTLTQELSKSKTAERNIESCLQKAEHAFDELEAESKQQNEQMETTIKDLESKIVEAQATIAVLEDESRKNAAEAENYRQRIEATLEGARRRGSIAFVPEDSDAAFAKTDELFRELDNLRHKTAALSNLLLSCIRSNYENCLVQEKLLADNGSELHTNNRKLKISLEPTNDMARVVLGHLGSADESDVIDWTSILANETDQRHIMGNLQNRLQIGQFSIDKALQKIYKAHADDIHKCQEAHAKQLEERRSRIWDLEKMLTDAISVNRKYENKIIKMREKYDYVEPQIEFMRGILRKTRRDCMNNNDAMSHLKDDYGRMRILVNKLLLGLRASKEKIQAQKQDLAEHHEAICNRDAAIEQLEKLLEKITHKYAENERLRIKITHEAAAQAVPAVIDVSCHADFLPTPSRGAVSTSPMNKKLCDALLPGRILNVADENWPTLINLGPTKSGLQFRRAIDKL